MQGDIFTVQEVVALSYTKKNEGSLSPIIKVLEFFFSDPVSATPNTNHKDTNALRSEASDHKGF